MAAKLALVVFTLTILQIDLAAKIIAQDLNDSNPDFNVTSKTDDYALQNERQYLAVIKSLNDELEAYKANYAKQLETINTQSELLEVNLLNIELRLISLELLNDASKYCVQRYKARLPSVFTTKHKIRNCTISAQSTYTSIVSSAQIVISNMNSYMNIQFKSGLESCVKRNARPSLNYTFCVIKAIGNADSSIITYRNTFNTQMKQSTCSGDNRVKQAVECSFSNVYSSIYTSGEVMNLINNCIDGQLVAGPSCLHQETLTPPNLGCPNVLNLQMTPTIYTNKVIENPFLGLNATISCVELKFQSTEGSNI